MRSHLRPGGIPFSIDKNFSYEDNSVGYPTQVRYFWDYCPSVNITFKKERLLKAIQDDEESLRRRNTATRNICLKMKVELAALVA